MEADHWLDHLKRKQVIKPNASKPTRDFDDIRNSLAAKGLVGVHDNLVWSTKT